MTFSDELDEKESLIEFNKQRKKTPSQFFNEDKTLRDIYSERAKRRQVEAGKVGGELAGRGRPVEDRGVLNLAPAYEDEDKGKTRDKVAEAIGINRNTLETIREIGSLAETGTTATAKEEPKKPAVSNPVKLTVAPAQVDEEEEENGTKCRRFSGITRF